MNHPVASISATLMTQEKQIVFTSIEQQIQDVQGLGHDIWRYAETAGMEEKSHNKLCKFLTKKGFKVQEHYMGFRNTFRAEFGEGESGGSIEHPNICFLCQYNAEERGHSKGHNLVVVNAITAALGLQTVIKFATYGIGRVTVIGCSSNTDNTLKSYMFEKKVFKDIDFILTSYPANYTNLAPVTLASRTYNVLYKGRTETSNENTMANPVNASVLAYQNIGAIRSTFKEHWSAKGIITFAGTRVNVTPSTSTMEWMLRAPRPDDMVLLDKAYLRCMESAATATGCVAQVKPAKKDYVCNITCPTLKEIYINNATLNGFTFHNLVDNYTEPDDIALVSTSIPVLKVIYYNGGSAELDTDAFTRYVGSKDSQFAQVVQGKTLAMTAVDLMMSEEIMKVVFSQHQRELSRVYSGFEPETMDASTE